MIIFIAIATIIIILVWAKGYAENEMEKITQVYPAAECQFEKLYNDKKANIERCINAIRKDWQVAATRDAIVEFTIKYRKQRNILPVQQDYLELIKKLEEKEALVKQGIYQVSA